eukprot:CAMPEP_0184867082 /NCGR_PEP_ID=MMETSP0580-20130426/25034_1 /TAXON_ID=1118495 /ORGANISM="Dactyliosolen fragilissimus" /LENGTH=114 /DNA_ID=CAMNT_0027367129 /DNA_START=96 /DNA_END=440 /DNA_ORIENTATION=-
MKYIAFLTLFIIVSLSNALAPPTSLDSRRAFLSQATSATVIAFSGAAPALAKDEYSLDTGSVTVPKKEKEVKSNEGGALVGGALAGSVALSLPFFLPNLMRMAGINNAKNPDQK